MALPPSEDAGSARSEAPAEPSDATRPQQGGGGASQTGIRSEGARFPRRVGIPPSTKDAQAMRELGRVAAPGRAAGGQARAETDNCPSGGAAAASRGRCPRAPAPSSLGDRTFLLSLQPLLSREKREAGAGWGRELSRTCSSGCAGLCLGGSGETSVPRAGAPRPGPRRFLSRLHGDVREGGGRPRPPVLVRLQPPQPLGQDGRGGPWGTAVGDGPPSRRRTAGRLGLWPLNGAA